jgi:hypothetical protein
MLEALRAANAPSPVSAPSDQSPAGRVPAQTGAPQPNATQPAAGGMLEALRHALHNKVDSLMDAENPSYDENGKMQVPGHLLDTERAMASSIPGPQSDLIGALVDTMADKQTMRDTLHSAVDAGLDRAARAQVVKGVVRGAQQGLSGFNEGLGNVVFALPDALNKGTDYVAGKVAAAIGASPPPPVQSSHDYYNRAFVAPAGQPETKLEQRIRGAARSFGTDTPALLLGGGLATAGVRSGVTLAEQEAPGLLETVREPATGLANKLNGMVPNYINAMRPTNIANAVRASNLQGAADTTLERVAAHPRLTAYGDFAKDWRAQKKREAQAN